MEVTKHGNKLCIVVRLKEKTTTRTSSYPLKSFVILYKGFNETTGKEQKEKY